MVQLSDTGLDAGSNLDGGKSGSFRISSQLYPHATAAMALPRTVPVSVTINTYYIIKINNITNLESKLFFWFIGTEHR